MRSQHLMVSLFAVLAACADGTGATDDPLAIVGTYDDDFGGRHTITETEWVQDYGAYGILSFDIVAHRNDGGWLVAQNAAANEFNPDLWSRFEWVTETDQLFYCQIVFDGAEEADAYDAGPADVSDLDIAGCGGAPWSALNP